MEKLNHDRLLILQSLFIFSVKTFVILSGNEMMWRVNVRECNEKFDLIVHFNIQANMMRYGAFFPL